MSVIDEILKNFTKLNNKINWTTNVFTLEWLKEYTVLLINDILSCIRKNNITYTVDFIKILQYAIGFMNLMFKKLIPVNMPIMPINILFLEHDINEHTF